MVLHWRRCGRVGGCRIKFGGVAQLGEHLPCKQGVMSSNLTISTKVMRREVSANLADTETCYFISVMHTMHSQLRCEEVQALKQDDVPFNAETKFRIESEKRTVRCIRNCVAHHVQARNDWKLITAYESKLSTHWLISNRIVPWKLHIEKMNYQ